MSIPAAALPDLRRPTSRIACGAVVTAPAVSRPHALAGAALPRHHRDPFDRLLIAQAQVERLTVITADPVFARYGVPVQLTGQ